MNKVLVFLFCFISIHAEQIHVLFTSALIDRQYERRKDEYLVSIGQLRSLGFDPWVIEATNIHSSFYDQVTQRVLYPNQNNLALRNKGVNELASIRECFSKLPFDDDDIVIKITGRYFLKDNSFIEEIKATQSMYDVWGLYGKHFVGKNHLVTGCFAMRWKVFKEVMGSIDLIKAEVDYISVEQLIAEQIEQRQLRLKRVNDLHLTARVFFGETDAQLLEF